MSDDRGQMTDDPAGTQSADSAIRAEDSDMQSVFCSLSSVF